LNIVLAYDVNTETPMGQKRLRKVARICEDWGCRVQNSVFECTVNEEQMQRMRAKLLEIIDRQDDSLRIYRLHGERSDCVEVYGRDTYVDPFGPLVY
jgi:CRISPR-associated protein Cas2